MSSIEDVREAVRAMSHSEQLGWGRAFCRRANEQRPGPMADLWHAIGRVMLEVAQDEKESFSGIVAGLEDLKPVRVIAVSLPGEETRT